MLVLEVEGDTMQMIIHFGSPCVRPRPAVAAGHTRLQQLRTRGRFSLLLYDRYLKLSSCLAASACASAAHGEASPDLVDDFLILFVFGFGSPEQHYIVVADIGRDQHLAFGGLSLCVDR